MTKIEICTHAEYFDDKKKVVNQTKVSMLINMCIDICILIYI